MTHLLQHTGGNPPSFCEDSAIAFRDRLSSAKIRSLTLHRKREVLAFECATTTLTASSSHTERLSLQSYKPTPGSCTVTTKRQFTLELEGP